MNAWNDLEQIKSEFCIVRFSHSRFSIFMHDLWVCFINHAHHTGAAEWVSRLAYLNLYKTFFWSKFLTFLKYFSALNILTTNLATLLPFEKIIRLLESANEYCTRTIIICSWFETALDYKPRILLKNFLV